LSPDNLSLAGVGEIEEDALISIYPNPTSGELNIQNVKGQIDQIQLFDAMGRLVSTFNPGFGKLNVSGLEAGIYVLNIHIEGRIVSRNITIQ